jgi:5-(carboxyamino)imidazole ribonucleotide synthase
VNIGVLGGGQLGRMLALAGYPLGHGFVFLDPAPEALCGLGSHVVAAADDARALDELAGRVDLVTYEFENVPVSAVRALAARIPVYPSAEALAASQDRLLEKTLFTRLGIPTAPFAAVDTLDALERALDQIGLPAVLKTRRLGYDGKGQAVIRERRDAAGAWTALAGLPCIVEGFVRFGRELSCLGVRDRDGMMAFYPLVENRHEGGILRGSLAPAPGSAALQREAAALVRRIAEHLDYVGVLALELFEAEGQLTANEMAPRVHNSGHWTIEGAETSQFENHVRAITGAPIGSTAPVGVSAMLNLIGSWPRPSGILALPGTHLHLYGKAPRTGRKVGHVTLRCDDRATLDERLHVLERLVRGTSEDETGPPSSPR